MNPQREPTIEQLECDLRSLDHYIEAEREAEKRGTTRFSRLPGLMGERDNLARTIALMKEPQDLALSIAQKLAKLPAKDVVSVAQFLRAELQQAANSDPAPSDADLPEGIDSEGGSCD